MHFLKKLVQSNICKNINPYHAVFWDFLNNMHFLRKLVQSNICKNINLKVKLST